MTRNGPLLTLLAGGALAGVLLAASINAASGQDDPTDPALAGGNTATPRPDDTPTPQPDDNTPPPDNPEPLPYVGWSDDGTASVAVIIDGDQATAYVCDGAAIEVWLNGPARNGELLLESDTGDTLIGSYNDQQAQGRTTIQSQELTFTIEAVEAPEGLYRFADTIPGGAEVDGGWIILPDGTQIGLLTVNGHTNPAPALDPATGQVDIAGQTVTAERVGG